MIYVTIADTVEVFQEIIEDLEEIVDFLSRGKSKRKIEISETPKYLKGNIYGLQKEVLNNEVILSVYVYRVPLLQKGTYLFSIPNKELAEKYNEKFLSIERR